MDKSSKHQEPVAADQEVNTIGRCEIDSRADTCHAGNNWRLLSTTGHLCDEKLFHRSYEAITNVLVGRASIEVVYGDVIVYIFILNEAPLFGNLMNHSLINPNHIRPFGILVSNDPFDRTWDFGIYHEEIFIKFRTEGEIVLLDTYVPSDHKLETCDHTLLTDGQVEQKPAKITMDRNMPYRYKAYVT